MTIWLCSRRSRVFNESFEKFVTIWILDTGYLLYIIVIVWPNSPEPFRITHRSSCELVGFFLATIPPDNFCVHFLLPLICSGRYHTFIKNENTNNEASREAYSNQKRVSYLDRCNHHKVTYRTNIYS